MPRARWTRRAPGVYVATADGRYIGAVEKTMRKSPYGDVARIAQWRLIGRVGVYPTLALARRAVELRPWPHSEPPAYRIDLRETNAR